MARMEALVCLIALLFPREKIGDYMRDFAALLFLSRFKISHWRHFVYQAIGTSAGTWVWISVKTSE